jgi:hypothetical protein
MDENILTALALDESKALASVEPLHCSLFFTHCIYSFLLTVLRSYVSPAGLAALASIELSAAAVRKPSQVCNHLGAQKKAASVTLRPLQAYRDAIQEQQTHQ